MKLLNMHEHTTSLRKVPEFVSGEVIKKFLAEVLPQLDRQGYRLTDENITVRIPIGLIPDEVEVPVHFIPSLKHEHLQNVPSIREIFCEWMQGKFNVGDKNANEHKEK